MAISPNDAMRRWVVLMSLGAMCLRGAPVSGQSANYLRILEMYRRGEFSVAVDAFARLPEDERYRGAQNVVRESLQPFRRDLLQAVLALHTEAALSRKLSLCDGTPEGTPSPQAVLGGRFPLFEHGLVAILSTRFPDDEFLRTWNVTVMAYGARGFGFGSCYGNAPARIRAHPEMQLALGAAHETNWQQEQADYGFRLSFRASLEHAERAFRAALQAAPDLHEARLRLGHVLLLQGKPDEALQTFHAVRGNLDGGFAYVERLLEGRAHEQRGDMHRAAELYRAARTMRPNAQSAVVALALLAFTQGHRAEALTYVQELPGTTTAGLQRQPWVWHAEGADPWSWYYFGTAWRFPAYLARLRALVTQKRSIEAASETHAPRRGAPSWQVSATRAATVRQGARINHRRHGRARSPNAPSARLGEARLP